MENKGKTGRLSGKGSRLWKNENTDRADGMTGSFWLRLAAKIPKDKRKDLLWAFLLTAALFIPLCVKFDFYYDLNDDVLIKDVLSGVYSGTPDGHTMQLLYPLGFCLSLLYRGLSIPVFGVFLAVCQYGSIFLITYRTARQCEAGRAKFVALLAEGAFWAAAFGSHLVFLQYTVTAGMLAGAAVFWMLTSDGGSGAAFCCDAAEADGRSGAASGCDAVEADGSKNAQVRGGAALWRPAAAFLRKNLPALILYWLAFCLRSEMALLLLPLAGVAGLCKWGQERRIFTKENACKYLLTFGMLVLGLVVCLGLDSFAYAEEDWSAFRQFFDERTELYDYQKDFIDNYEENEAYYEALGVSMQQHALLANYNFGVDDSIDENLLAELKEAAVNRPGAGGFFRKSVSEGLWSLVYGHWTAKGDFPYNVVFVLCGGFAFALCFLKGKRRFLWQAPLCAVTGGALWMFLLLRDRLADRVLHPLYLGQILVFVGLVLLEMKTDGRKREPGPALAGDGTAVTVPAADKGTVQAAKGRSAADDGNALDGYAVDERGGLREKNASRMTVVRAAAAALSVLVLVICALQAVKTYRATSEEYARREAVNQTNEAVLAYCSAHPGRLYLEDVYSTVSYSEKISVDRNKPFNYDLLGGWLVKSPLTKEKLGAFGYASMEEAVRAGGNVSLLVETENDMQWLREYFAWRQVPVRVVKTGTVTEGVDVYQVVPEGTQESILAPHTANEG